MIASNILQIQSPVGFCFAEQLQSITNCIQLMLLPTWPDAHFQIELSNCNIKISDRELSRISFGALTNVNITISNVVCRTTSERTDPDTQYCIAFTGSMINVSYVNITNVRHDFAFSQPGNANPYQVAGASTSDPSSYLLSSLWIRNSANFSNLIQFSVSKYTFGYLDLAATAEFNNLEVFVQSINFEPSALSFSNLDETRVGFSDITIESINLTAVSFVRFTALRFVSVQVPSSPAHIAWLNISNVAVNVTGLQSLTQISRFSAVEVNLVPNTKNEQPFHRILVTNITGFVSNIVAYGQLILRYIMFVSIIRPPPALRAGALDDPHLNFEISESNVRVAYLRSDSDSASQFFGCYLFGGVSGPEIKVTLAQNKFIIDRFASSSTFVSLKSLVHVVGAMIAVTPNNLRSLTIRGTSLLIRQFDVYRTNLRLSTILISDGTFASITDNVTVSSSSLDVTFKMDYPVMKYSSMPNLEPPTFNLQVSTVAFPVPSSDVTVIFERCTLKAVVDGNHSDVARALDDRVYLIAKEATFDAAVVTLGKESSIIAWSVAKSVAWIFDDLNAECNFWIGGGSLSSSAAITIAESSSHPFYRVQNVAFRSRSLSGHETTLEVKNSSVTARTHFPSQFEMLMLPRNQLPRINSIMVGNFIAYGAIEFYSLKFEDLRSTADVAVNGSVWLSPASSSSSSSSSKNSNNNNNRGIQIYSIFVNSSINAPSVDPSVDSAMIFNQIVIVSVIADAIDANIDIHAMHFGSTSSDIFNQAANKVLFEESSIYFFTANSLTNVGGGISVGMVYFAGVVAGSLEAPSETQISSSRGKLSNSNTHELLTAVLEKKSGSPVMNGFSGEVDEERSYNIVISNFVFDTPQKRLEEVSSLTHFRSEGCEIKLDGNVTNYEKNIYIGCLYVAPSYELDSFPSPTSTIPTMMGLRMPTGAFAFESTKIQVEVISATKGEAFIFVVFVGDSIFYQDDSSSSTSSSGSGAAPAERQGFALETSSDSSSSEETGNDSPTIKIKSALLDAKTLDSLRFTSALVYAGKHLLKSSIDVEKCVMVSIILPSYFVALPSSAVFTVAKIFGNIYGQRNSFTVFDMRNEVAVFEGATLSDLFQLSSFELGGRVQNAKFDASITSGANPATVEGLAGFGSSSLSTTPMLIRISSVILGSTSSRSQQTHAFSASSAISIWNHEASITFSGSPSKTPFLHVDVSQVHIGSSITVDDEDMWTSNSSGAVVKISIDESDMTIGDSADTSVSFASPVVPSCVLAFINVVGSLPLYANLGVSKSNIWLNVNSEYNNFKNASIYGMLLQNHASVFMYAFHNSISAVFTGKSNAIQHFRTAVIRCLEQPLTKFESVESIFAVTASENVINVEFRDGAQLMGSSDVFAASSTTFFRVSIMDVVAILDFDVNSNNILALFDRSSSQEMSNRIASSSGSWSSSNFIFGLSLVVLSNSMSGDSWKNVYSNQTVFRAFKCKISNNSVETFINSSTFFGDGSAAQWQDYTTKKIFSSILVLAKASTLSARYELTGNQIRKNTNNSGVYPASAILFDDSLANRPSETRSMWDSQFPSSSTTIRTTILFEPNTISQKSNENDYILRILPSISTTSLEPSLSNFLQRSSWQFHCNGSFSQQAVDRLNSQISYSKNILKVTSPIDIVIIRPCLTPPPPPPPPPAPTNATQTKEQKRTAFALPQSSSSSSLSLSNSRRTSSKSHESFSDSHSQSISESLSRHQNPFFQIPAPSNSQLAASALSLAAGLVGAVAAEASSTGRTMTALALLGGCPNPSSFQKVEKLVAKTITLANGTQMMQKVVTVEYHAVNVWLEDPLPFPMSLLPGVQLTGSYIKAALASYALLFAVMVLLALMIGFIRSRKYATTFEKNKELLLKTCNKNVRTSSVKKQRLLSDMPTFFECAPVVDFLLRAMSSTVNQWGMLIGFCLASQKSSLIADGAAFMSFALLSVVAVVVIIFSVIRAESNDKSGNNNNRNERVIKSLEQELLVWKKKTGKLSTGANDKNKTNITSNFRQRLFPLVVESQIVFPDPCSSSSLSLEARNFLQSANGNFCFLGKYSWQSVDQTANGGSKNILAKNPFVILPQRGVIAILGKILAHYWGPRLRSSHGGVDRRRCFLAAPFYFCWLLVMNIIVSVVLGAALVQPDKFCDAARIVTFCLSLLICVMCFALRPFLVPLRTICILTFESLTMIASLVALPGVLSDKQSSSSKSSVEIAREFFFIVMSVLLAFRILLVIVRTVIMQIAGKYHLIPVQTIRKSYPQFALKSWSAKRNRIVEKDNDDQEEVEMDDETKITKKVSSTGRKLKDKKSRQNDNATISLKNFDDVLNVKKKDSTRQKEKQDKTKPNCSTKETKKKIMSHDNDLSKSKTKGNNMNNYQFPTL